MTKLGLTAMKILTSEASATSDCFEPVWLEAVWPKPVRLEPIWLEAGKEPADWTEILRRSLWRGSSWQLDHDKPHRSAARVGEVRGAPRPHP